MSCLLCFGLGQKMNLKINSDKNSRRDKSSSSSSTAKPAGASPSSEAVQATPARAPPSSEAVQATPAGAPASSEAVQAKPAGASPSSEAVQATPAGALASSETVQVSASSETVQVSGYRCQSFSYRELATATNNFSYESFIGRGGFGIVYKGRIDTGENIAVKMLDKSGLQGDKEFLVEILMLSLLHHENLVHLYGYCAEADHRLLVYEYMPLGSLEDRIHDLRDDQEALEWITRMKIARGVAKGLAYLHYEAKVPVIYRDLKSSNILLDHEYKPKLSDFGFAKIGPSENMSHVSGTRVMGTPGYCAPEYGRKGILTLKADIYSFGVVLLELITGHKALMASSDCMGSPDRSLVTWTKWLYSRGKILQIVDPVLMRTGGFSENMLRKALRLAFLCLSEEPNVRPSIRGVVKALDNIVDNESWQNIRLGRGVDPMRAGTSSSPNEITRNMLNVNEEEENGLVERKISLADAKSWAYRQCTNPNPPMATPEKY